MPTLEDFMKRSRNIKDYKLFLDKFVRQVVGCRRFDILCATSPIESFVSVSDEAYALLVFENQVERWKLMAATGQKKVVMQAKFTDGGGGKNLPKEGRNRKARGWSPKGIRRFAQLCKMVESDRATPEGRELQRQYLQHRIGMSKAKPKKATKKVYQGDDGEEPLEVYNELDKVFAAHANSPIDPGMMVPDAFARARSATDDIWDDDQDGFPVGGVHSV